MDVCMTDSLYYTAETNTVDQLYSDKNLDKEWMYA